MPTITPETFDQMLQKQRPNILKWRDLNEGQIYTIIGKETVKTNSGDALVINIENEGKVWACSSLAKRLEEDKDKKFPCYVRPKGKIQSKQNKGFKYYGFDGPVWSE